MDLHQLASHQRVVGVRVSEIAAEVRARYQGVEHRGARNRRLDRETARFTTESDGLVLANQSRWCYQCNGWKTMRITRGQNNRVRARKRRSHEHSGLVDHPADKIRDQRDVEARGIANRGAIRTAEAEQIDGVNGVGAGQRVDVVAPLVRPARRLDPVNEEDRRAFAVPGEGDPSVTPFEPSFLSTNEVDELIDAFSRKRVVSRGCAKEGSAG